MVKVLQEQDVPVGSFIAISEDGTEYEIEQMELRRLVQSPLGGPAEWSAPATWYRCGNIEVTPEPDDTYLLQKSPQPVRLRRR
ncbi:MAG: hypothetical protein AMXMBFR78_11350 [Rubrivivax sp.]|jgi:hypothetical protein